MTASVPEPSWRRLYLAGAWASLAYVLLVLVPMALLFLAPLPPATGAAVLEYIQAHRVVYLIELVCFVGLSIPAIVVFCAWAVALWPVDRSLALVGGLFGVGSEITALAVGSSPQSLNGGLVVLSGAYRSASTAEERAGLASAADAIVATTNAMPWAGVLTAAGILLLSLACRLAWLSLMLEERMCCINADATLRSLPLCGGIVSPPCVAPYASVRKCRVASARSARNASRSNPGLSLMPGGSTFMKLKWPALGTRRTSTGPGALFNWRACAIGVTVSCSPA